MIAKKKYNRDFTIILTFGIIAALIGYLFPLSNIGFFIALGSVVYVLIRGDRNYTLVYTMMIILAYDFFGVVPWLSIGSGTLHWYDINVVFSALLIIKTLKARKHAKYSYIIYIYFAFIGLACFRSWMLYRQSVLTTLLSARTSFVMIGYGSIVYLIKKDRINRTVALEIFEKVSIFALICYWIQFIFVNIGIDITYLPTKARWGIRVYINFLFVIFYYFYNLYYLIYKRENVRKHIMRCLFCVLTIAVVSQSRSTLFYIAIVSMIMVLLSLKIKKILTYSILIAVFGSTLMLIPFTRTVIISSALETTYNDTGSIAYRKLETQYYMNQLQGNELLGLGIPNKHDVSALEYSGRKSDVVDVRHRTFNLTDLGAFKIRYQFGIIGYILYFVMLGVLLIGNFKSKSRGAPPFAAMSMVVYLIFDSSMIEILTRVPFLMMLVLMYFEIDFSIMSENRKAIKGN